MNQRWEVAAGQPELLEVPPDMITLPRDTIVDIANWTTSVVGNLDLPLSVDPVRSAVVARRTDGRAVTEHPVSLGPHGLFGMVTDPGVAPRPETPTVVMLSAGALPHTGPGRMWVQLARDIAEFGLPSIRVDIDGVGESFGRSQLARQVPKPPEAIDDLEDIARALGDPDAHNLVFVGLSSGGYHALEAGLHLHPRGVCAINPGLVGWVPEIDLGYVDRRRLAIRPMPRALRSLSVRHDRIARWTWWSLLQLWVTRSPNHAVAGVSRRCTPVLLVVSESDAEQFEPSWYWPIAHWRLRRRGLLDVRLVKGSDHSLYTRRGRETAYPLVLRWLREQFAPR